MLCLLELLAHSLIVQPMSALLTFFTKPTIIGARTDTKLLLLFTTVVAERKCFHKHVSRILSTGGVCMAGGICGRGKCMAGCVCVCVCVARGAYMAGDMHGRGHVC